MRHGFPKLATCEFSSNPPLFSKIRLLFSQTRHLSPQIRGGATNAAIWAEQQLVAIPGWLLVDPNAILHQEGQFASIKEPRSPTTKKNKAKRRTIHCGGGGNKPFPPPPPPPRGGFLEEPPQFNKKKRG